MQETNRIAGELEKAVEGNAWHGPALNELLKGVSAPQAAARPIGNAHTIREIVLHIAAWENVVRGRIEGRVVDEPDEGDWPDVNGTDETAWARAREQLKSAQEKLLAAISKLSDERLSDKAPGSDRTIYETLHGVIQHNLYHAGQIAILKKGV